MKIYFSAPYGEYLEANPEDPFGDPLIRDDAPEEYKEAFKKDQEELHAIYESGGF